MSVYILDTETTDKNEPEIIEAAWLRLAIVTDLLGPQPDLIPATLSVEREHNQRYLPSKPVTCSSIAAHHILPHELCGCQPSSSFQLPEDCEYVIGHSIDFDWQAIGSPANVKRICTHAMAQWVWPDFDGYSQSALLYRLLGATTETRDRLMLAHAASADCWNNLTLLRHILLVKPDIRTWSTLHAFSEECRIPRTCPMKKYEGVLLEDLDDGLIVWCLRQDFIDPYYRKGLERVMAKRRELGEVVW